MANNLFNDPYSIDYENNFRGTSASSSSADEILRSMSRMNLPEIKANPIERPAIESWVTGQVNDLMKPEDYTDLRKKEEKRVKTEVEELLLRGKEASTEQAGKLNGLQSGGFLENLAKKEMEARTYGSKETEVVEKNIKQMQIDRTQKALEAGLQLYGVQFQEKIEQRKIDLDMQIKEFDIAYNKLQDGYVDDSGVYVQGIKGLEAQIQREWEQGESEKARKHTEELEKKRLDAENELTKKQETAGMIEALGTFLGGLLGGPVGAVIGGAGANVLGKLASDNNWNV